MDTLSRHVGTLLGLAVGDARGWQLHEALDPDRVPTVADGPLDCSGRTDQALLTARAICATGLRAPTREILTSLAGELARWWHRPEDVGRSLSESTRRSAWQLLGGARWEDVGNPAGDGVEPLFRAIVAGLSAPPVIACERAAALAAISHRHPAAVEASAATAWLVSELTRGHGLHPALVLALAEREIAPSLRDDLVRAAAGQVPAELVAVELPAEEGGYRAAIALVLALEIALRPWGEPGPTAFAEAVQLATATHGADAVAALVGALLGAAWGSGAIPAAEVDRLRCRDDLVDLARALHRGSRPRVRSAGEAPSGDPPGWTAPAAAPRSWAPQALEATDPSWTPPTAEPA